MLGLLVLLVAAAAAQHNGGHTDPPHPGHCKCAPNQFSASTGMQASSMTNGFQTVTQDVQRFQYDYTAKMLYTQLSSTNVMTAVTTNMTILQDFNAMKQYLTLQDGNCYYQPLTTPMRSPCVPDDAVLVGQVRLGGGLNGITGNAWSYSMDGANSTMVLDSENCYPLIDASYGNIYGSNQQLVMFFFDFVPIIDDVKKFTVPSNCNTPLPTPPTGTDAAPVGRR